MKMRNGLSPEYSTKKNDPLLKDLQFKYLEDALLAARIHQGVNTSVTLKARLFVLIGEVNGSFAGQVQSDTRRHASRCSMPTFL